MLSLGNEGFYGHAVEYNDEWSLVSYFVGITGLMEVWHFEEGVIVAY